MFWISYEFMVLLLGGSLQFRGQRDRSNVEISSLKVAVFLSFQQAHVLAKLVICLLSFLAAGQLRSKVGASRVHRRKRSTLTFYLDIRRLEATTSWIGDLLSSCPKGLEMAICLSDFVALICFPRLSHLSMSPRCFKPLRSTL